MSWKEVLLGDMLSYEQPTRYIVESEDYNDSYQTPVLTAGKSFILGYTNEPDNIYENLPAIIFDDFTADSKFVDFPFKVKSSAMKILTCDPEKVDIRFAFYLMQTLKVDTEQHKRYWISKFANISVPLPPLPIQKRIAEILDAADALRKKDQELLKKYDELAQAIFIDMFGDPVKNEKGWEVAELIQICNDINVGFVGTCEPFYTNENNGVPLIRTGNLGEGFLKLNNLKYITREFHLKQKKSILEKGNILIARHGDNGKAVLYGGEFKEANCLNIVIVKLKKNVSEQFVLYQINHPSIRNWIAGRTGGATQKVINTKQIEKIPIIIPPIDLQKRFAEVIFTHGLITSKAQASHSPNLFNALLKLAFSDELIL